MKFFYEHDGQEAEIKQNENHQHGVKEIIRFLKENQIIKYIILVSVVLNFSILPLALSTICSQRATLIR